MALLPWGSLRKVRLASEEAAMVTGTNITVDGGATAKHWLWVLNVG